MKTSRRDFIVGIGAAALAARGDTRPPVALAEGTASPPNVGDVYPGWRPGELDIHFIQTGVGEQTFFIFPDGTTMLLDCGDGYSEKYLKDIPRRPSADRLGGEWVSRYVQRLIPQRTIDYFLLSHWHGDHCGAPSLRTKTLPDGRKVCGIALFAEDFDIRHYFDHQWPRAGVYAYDADKRAMEMVREWISHMQRRCGMEPHQFKVGALNQIALLHDAEGRYAESFSIRNICSNAVYWDGVGGLVDFAPEYIGNHPNLNGGIYENSLSNAIRIQYGPFRAFFGGDIDFPTYEACLGRVVGSVDVCKTNHHACPSSMGAAFCASVTAKVYMSSVWGTSQITSANLVNMTSRNLYPGERIVMYGHMPDVKREHYAGRAFMKDVVPVQGHSVIKVAPGGKVFDALVLTNEDESMRILYRKGFASRGRI